MRLALASLSFVVVLAAALPGCKASAGADLNAKTVDDFNTPIDPSLNEPPPSELVLFGVRQDLTFRGATSPNCSCLAVALGVPGDPSFQWAGKPPAINRDSQLVIALTSSGVSCASSGAPGASYWGYEMIGENVVVVVENAVPGRPVASGAIIPRPIGNGQVFVKAADKKVPYGRPPGGATGDRCQVSQLVAAASAVLAAPEVVESAPAPANSGRGKAKAGASGGFEIGGGAKGSATVGTP